jgi:hypothetical protein
MTPELLEYSRGELIRGSFVRGDAAKGEDVGRLSLARVEEQMETLLRLRIMDSPIPIEQLVTTEFLPAPARPVEPEARK